MIAKIKTRVDFGGIVNYANDQKNKKKCATLLAHEGVCAISNKLIADSFCLQASMRPKVKSPVKHVSLAFSSQDISRFPDNGEGDALMVEIAKKWMEQMGIRNTQYIIARHHDTKHPHCHLVFNRIDNEGNLISDSNERIRNAKVCRALTKEYGLYFAPKNSKARNKSRLRPHQLRKYNLRSSVLDARANSHSWNDFFSILKGLGIDMRFNHAENSDKIRGISFSQDEYSMAGSKLDRDLSFNSLCATLGNVAAELIIQPHQAIIPSGGGGGTNNEQGWRNDKDKDNQRNEGFCWNNVLTTYMKCKKKEKTVQSTESMSFFSCVNQVPEFYLISLMNSRFAAIYVDNFINSTSHCTTGDAKLIPVLIPDNEILKSCNRLFTSAFELKKSVAKGITTDISIQSELEIIEEENDNLIACLYSI